MVGHLLVVLLAMRYIAAVFLGYNYRNPFSSSSMRR